MSEDMTEAGELRVRLQFVEHDLEHVVRERDLAVTEVARLREIVALTAQWAERLGLRARTYRGPLAREVAELATDLCRALDGDEATDG